MIYKAVILAKSKLPCAEKPKVCSFGTFTANYKGKELPFDFFDSEIYCNIVNGYLEVEAVLTELIEEDFEEEYKELGLMPKDLTKNFFKNYSDLIEVYYECGPDEDNQIELDIQGIYLFESGDAKSVMMNVL